MRSKGMKKTPEEHLEFIRANARGMSRGELRDKITAKITVAARSEAAKMGQPMPTLVISEEHIAAAVKANDDALIEIIKVVQAVLRGEGLVRR